MGSNFDFTDKTQETLAAAIQLAKDYANAHGMHSNYVMKGALD
jgi:ATP-dependent Clp protease ATP-binding subunit ClpB